MKGWRFEFLRMECVWRWVADKGKSVWEIAQELENITHTTMHDLLNNRSSDTDSSMQISKIQSESKSQKDSFGRSFGLSPCEDWFVARYRTFQCSRRRMQTNTTRLFICQNYHSHSDSRLFMLTLAIHQPRDLANFNIIVHDFYTKSLPRKSQCPKNPSEWQRTVGNAIVDEWYVWCVRAVMCVIMW